MKKQSLQDLKSSIKNLSYQIYKMRTQLNSSETINRKYNQLLIERACLRKKLNDLQSKNVISFLFNKFEKKPKQKLICDYFKTKC